MYYFQMSSIFTHRYYKMSLLTTFRHLMESCSTMLHRSEAWQETWPIIIQFSSKAVGEPCWSSSSLTLSYQEEASKLQLITNLVAWEHGAFAPHPTFVKLTKETVDMPWALMMTTMFCLLIMNVQLDSNVDMTIAHLNLNCLPGWIVAISQNGEGAKTLWTWRKEFSHLHTIPTTMSHTKNALGWYQFLKIIQWHWNLKPSP